VTTEINVTNESSVVLTNAFVTNTFSAAVAFIEFGNNYTTNMTAVTNGSTLILDIPYFTNGAAAQIVFSWQPQAYGTLTNAIEVGSTDSDMTATAATNLVFQEIYSEEASLGVSLNIVAPAALTNDWVITNDWVTLSLTVTNAGPDAVPGVLVTNVLPASMVLRGVEPGNTSYTDSTNNLVISAGTLASGTAVTYQFTLQPTNTGAFALFGGVGAPGLYDPSLISSVENHLYVTNYLATLAAGTNSTQVVNPQNGLIEQTIMVTNTGVTAVPAVRVVVTGLTNQLYNASGTNFGFNTGSTNHGSPFMVYPVALAAGGQIGLRLQYAPRLGFPFANSRLQAYAVPASVLNYAPLAATGQGTNINFRRILKTADGDMLLEFPTSTNRTYTVVYSDNVLFSNAQVALPVIVPPANVTQWLDYGPPTTSSAPTNSGQRFYRVYLNP
jgi:uncharacterized repeat protein (TIGR01451 family)